MSGAPRSSRPTSRRGCSSGRRSRARCSSARSAHAARGGVVVPGRRPVPDLRRAGHGRAGLGRRRQPSTSTSTAASAATSSGHAHPKIVEAIDRAARTGTHFAAHHRGDGRVRRGAVPALRARPGAVRQLGHRGDDGRDPQSRVPRPDATTIVKIEGSYHGHHDTVMFSVVPNADADRRARAAERHPDVEGHPRRGRQRTRTSCPFNDAAALERLLDERAGEVACVIIEPVMMNIGVVLARARATSRRVRELCTASRRRPHLRRGEVRRDGRARAARSSASACSPTSRASPRRSAAVRPTAAFGGRADVMDVIEHGAAQQGTFNGNPLVAAAGLAALTEVLTPDAYVHLAHLGTRLADGCAKAIAEHGLPAHTVDLGAKGCVSYRPEPLRNYRDFLETRTELYAASYPVGREPRRLHDARRRGAVDDLGAAHRRGHRPLRRRVRGVLRRGGGPRPADAALARGGRSHASRAGTGRGSWSRRSRTTA